MTTTPDDDVPVGGQGPARTVRTFGPSAAIGAAVGGIVVGVVLSLATGPVPGASGELSGERDRSEEHTSELQSRGHLVCRHLLENKTTTTHPACTVASARPPPVDS